MSVTVTMYEVQDTSGGHNKFYRAAAAENQWLTQYGRNGTLGTVTKPATASDRQAAIDAAEAKIQAKIKKGYDNLRGATIDVHGQFELNDPSFLDRLAQNELVPLTPGTAAPALVEILDIPVHSDSTRDDITPALATQLGVGTAAQPEDLHPTSPTRPMLASTQSADRIETMMSDPDILAQLKYDGERVVLEVTDGAVQVLNRAGRAKVRNVGSAHTEPFTALGTGRWVLDGELVDATLVLFDIAVASDGTTTWVGPHTGFAQRHAVLVKVLDALNLTDDDPIVLGPIHDDTVLAGAKLALLDATGVDGREGIILRNRYGTYEQGRRSNTVVKVKHVKDADVIVLVNDSGKNSVDLGVHDEAGELVRVGTASTIGKGDVQPGQIWTVTYLNVNDPEHPRLYQPRLVTQRDDKSAAECTIDQFAHAGANRTI